MGFNDELERDISLSIRPLYDLYDIRKIAYDLGVLDAIAGDDVSSLDLQTSALILINIKNRYYGEN